MTDSVRQFTVGYDDDGIRLDRWFKRHMPDTSFTTVAKWARTGQLRLDGARVKRERLWATTRWDTSLGTVVKFSGRVAEVSEIGRFTASMSL